MTAMLFEHVHKMFFDSAVSFGQGLRPSQVDQIFRAHVGQEFGS